MCREDAQYERVISDLVAAGCTAEFHRPGQLVVCLKEPVLSGRIWITWRGQWFICTWVPTVYCVPDDTDIIALCVACVTYPHTPFYQIPAPIVDQFRLRLLNESELEAWLDACS
jgi:hypothetical protein